MGFMGMKKWVLGMGLIPILKTQTQFFSGVNVCSYSTLNIQTKCDLNICWQIFCNKIRKLYFQKIGLEPLVCSCEKIKEIGFDLCKQTPKRHILILCKNFNCYFNTVSKIYSSHVSKCQLFFMVVFSFRQFVTFKLYQGLMGWSDRSVNCSVPFN